MYSLKYLNPKNIFVVLVIIFMLWICYAVAWVGLRNTDELKKMSLVKTKCYAYQSNADLKNIARHHMISTFGLDALKQQRQLKVISLFDGESFNVVGKPYGFLQSFYLYFLNQPYTPSISIMIHQDQNLKCVKVESVLYQKD